MKILITTTYWKKSDGGGIKTFLINLVQELERKGNKVDVIFAHGEDKNNYKISDSELNAPFPLKIWQAYLALKRLKPDAVHSHGGMYYYLIAGYCYRLFHGTAIVYTFHTEPDPDNRISPMRHFFLQNLLNRCDCVTFVSQTLRSKVEGIWGLNLQNTAITYAGVRIKEVPKSEKEDFRKTFSLNKNSKILLALGLTALSYKAEGLKILIEAVQRVRDQHPNVILVATRNGKYVPELKNFAKNAGLEDAVIFTGDVADSRVPLAVSDIFTHISLGEGLPIALLEAMAQGLPIIATPVGGIPEAIVDGRDGLLVKPDSREIADKIRYLLQNENVAEKLGQNARRTAEERFTWEKSASRFLDIYRKKRTANL